jgi:hypothetical protein
MWKNYVKKSGNLKDKEAGTYRGIWATSLLTTSYYVEWLISL